MKRKEMIKIVAEVADVRYVTAQKIIDSTFKVIANELKDGNNINVQGFGTFRIGRRNERIGIKPKTGEKIVVTPRNIVTFKASQKLKTYVNK